MITGKLLLIGLGGLLAIICIPGLINPKTYRKELKDFLSDKNTIRILGVIGLIMGFLFLSVNWKIEKNWLATISILGWITILKSTVSLLMPEYIKKMSKNWLKTDNFTIILCLVGIAFSLVLFYIANKYLSGIEIVSG